MAKTPILRALLRAFRLSSRTPQSAGAEAADLQELSSRALSRREFLTCSGAAAAALLTPGLTRTAGAAGPGDEPVAVLGAGIAGLTAAYRLEKAGVPWVLYEAGARLGGRIFTKRGFNADGMFCELGGELVDTDHRALRGLAGELSVPLESLVETKAGLTRNLYAFGGSVYTDEQLAAAVTPLLARVRADLAAIFGAGRRRMITYRDPAKQAAARFDDMTLSAYLDSLTGVDAWVRRAVEIAYVTEYGLDADRQSALNLLLLIGTRVEPGAREFEIFGDSDEAMRVAGGNSRLVEALATRLGLKDEGAARYMPGHALVKISDAGAKLALTFAAPGGSVEKRFSRAICTIPFSVLRSVDGISGLDMRPQKKESIAKMGYATNSKLMLGFTERFWRKPGGKVPPSNGGLFADWASQSYWETSRLQKGGRGILTNYTGGAAGAARAASDVKPSLADLETIFPGLSARFDGKSALMNWSRNPFNLGSYICPAPGEYTRTYGAAGQTECGGRLFFAGEHASPEGAGYMNGGVDSGNAAVEKLLGRRARGAAAH